MAIEREVKFYLNGTKNIQRRLMSAGAEIIHPRVLERNLRFDFPDRSLTAAGKVLRLRQDERVRLTFKERASKEDLISEHVELEMEVSDMQTAQDLLAALGYEVSVLYEKYRTTYRLHDVEIVLDELPFGIFLEIEGPDAASIQAAAAALGLNWKARATNSYIGLFEKICTAEMDEQQVTFEQLKGKTFTAADFGLIPAEGN